MVNYHGHTKRCKHAIGEDEEYVVNAIKAGYDIIGFSDHVMLPNCSKTYSVRADYSEFDDYMNSIKKLKKKYKDKIQILTSFECEWDVSFVDYYKSLIKNKQVDYLIFGNHYLIFEDGEFKWYFPSDEEYLQRYCDYAVEALKSGLFKIMAHPDFFMAHVNEFSDKALQISEIICKTAKECNVALELNCGAMNNGEKKMYGNEYRYRYPYYRFWEVAKKYQNVIVIGQDVHSPDTYLNNARNMMINYANSLGLSIVDNLFIKDNKNV